MWPCGPDVFAESLLNTDTRIKRRHVPLVFVLTGFCICNLFTLFLMLCFQKHDTPWLAIFSSPAVWGIIVAHFSNNWGFYTFLTCLPSYFKEVLNFSISKVRKTCWYQRSKWVTFNFIYRFLILFVVSWIISLFRTKF